LEPGAGYRRACSAPGAGPGSPNRGRNMVGERPSGNPPLEPPEAGPSFRGARDFLGSPCPRGRFLGGLLGGAADEANLNLDFDEYLRHVMDVYDSDDCVDEFEEYVEHLDNREW